MIVNTEPSSKEVEGRIYFQRQKMFSLQCGLHSVNNFLGFPCYNQEDFSQACESMSASTDIRHRGFCGGDYDVNILCLMLEKKKFATKWHDNRITFQIHPEDKGLLVNISNRSWYHCVLCFSARHWYSVVIREQDCLILDSVASNPLQISKENLVRYLKHEMETRQASILRIVPS